MRKYSASSKYRFKLRASARGTRFGSWMKRGNLRRVLVVDLEVLDAMNRREVALAALGAAVPDRIRFLH